MNRLSNAEPYGMHGYTPEKEDLLEAATEPTESCLLFKNSGGPTVRAHDQARNDTLPSRGCKSRTQRSFT